MATQCLGWRSLQGYIQFIGLQSQTQLIRLSTKHSGEIPININRIACLSSFSRVGRVLCGIRHSLWSVL